MKLTVWIVCVISLLGCTTSSNKPVGNRLNDSIQHENSDSNSCLKFKQFVNDSLIALLERNRDGYCSNCKNLYVESSLGRKGKINIKVILSEGLIHIDESVSKGPKLISGYYSFLGDYKLFLFESTLNSELVILKCNSKPVHDGLIKGGRWIKKEFEIAYQDE